MPGVTAWVCPRRRAARTVVASAEALEGRFLLAVNTFTSAGNINLSDAGGSGVTPASPYPRSITVPAIVTGNVTDVTVSLNGINHTFPDDLDMMLVSPGGQRLMLWSDAGGTGNLANRTIVLSDAGATALPDSTTPAAGTYRPTDFDPAGGADTFPAPAPAPGTATTFATFAGTNPVGTWSLYVVDDAGGSGDSGTIDSWSLTLTTSPPPTLIISEYRPQGPNGANDEFVELYNPSDSPLTVATSDGSSGWALRSSDNVTRFVVPNGTIVPGRGHFLAANSVGYSLGSYASPNVTYTANIPTGEAGAPRRGIALFRTNTAANFTLANRLDAVGPAAETNTLFREGAGHGNLIPFSVQGSLHRSLVSGLPKDTDNNLADFVFVDTNGTLAGAGQNLGAPGPENVASPVQVNASFPASLLDPSVAATAVPNRQHDFTVGEPGVASLGFHVIRRRFTNNTGGPITRLRFRVADVSTFPQPGTGADMRPTTIADSTIATSGGNVLVRGTTLEAPPAQPIGGGLNSSLVVPSVTPATPLAAGATINVQFAFGLQRLGDIRLALNAEALVLAPGTSGTGGAPVTDAGVAPLAPAAAPDLDPSTDGGVSNSDNLTNDNTPLFNGSATPNRTIHLFGSGVLVGTGAANGAGQYSINLTGALPDSVSNVTAAAAFENIVGPMSPGLGVNVDTVAPRVTEVLVAGTGWSAPYRTFLQSSGMGTDGFLVPAGPSQLLALPWVNLNLVWIRFSQDVIVDPADLSIRGVNVGSYVTPGFNYLGTSRTAIWQVAPAIGRDKLLLDLNGTTAGGVMDPAGNALDGEWLSGGATETYPSGNGTPGGDFEFRLNVLPGDVNGSGTVDGSDFAILASHFGRSPRHHTQGNLNGDLIVDGSDFAVLASSFGRTLPTGTPAVVAGAALVAPPVRRSVMRPVRRVVPTRARGVVMRRVTSPFRSPEPSHTS